MPPRVIGAGSGRTGTMYDRAESTQSIAGMTRGAYGLLLLSAGTTLGLAWAPARVIG